ncbi:MAG: FeoA family protein [Candidatus Bathyarchaeia archaeon]
MKRSLLIELLEIVKGCEAEGKKFDLNRALNELGSSMEELESVIQSALKDGLIEKINDNIRLTEEGKKEILEHQEEYLHSYFHPHDLFNKMRRVFGGKIENWREHWRRRHGVDNESLETFYSGLETFKGRIENAIPLSKLGPNEKAIVVFMLGGRGLVRRLADMGLTPGTEITILRQAPFHGPIEIMVRGVSLALGHGIARRIFVKPYK